MKIYFIHRPSMKGTSIPEFYYTFAENEKDAKLKVELKWGEFDPKTKVKLLKDSEIDVLVVATDYYG